MSEPTREEMLECLENITGAEDFVDERRTRRCETWGEDYLIYQAIRNLIEHRPRVSATDIDVFIDHICDEKDRIQQMELALKWFDKIGVEVSNG
jgi:hypothetical protein